MHFSIGLTCVSMVIKLIHLPLTIGALPQLAQVLAGTHLGFLTNTSKCKAYQIVAARGTDEPQSGSYSYAELIKIVEASVPGGSNMEIKYSASEEYAITPAQGASSGAAYVSSLAAQCPNQLYVLVGYSKGAMVITQLLNELRIAPNRVAAVVLFGNPYHTSHAPQNRCSGTAGEGIAAWTGVTMPAKYVPVTYDCCVQWDLICQIIGTMASHWSYGGSQNEKNAAAFVVSQLRSKLGSKVPSLEVNLGEKDV